MRLHWVVLGVIGCGAGEPVAVRERLAPGGPIPPQAMTQATVTSIIPGAAHVGDTLSLIGTGFVGMTVVTFPNALNATPTVADDAHLTVVIPSGAVNGTPRVDNGLGPGGDKPLVILETAAPTISSITPTSGGPSTNVQIAGTNLGGVYEVRVDGIEAALTNVSAGEVDAT